MLPRAESTSDHLYFATCCRNLLFCGFREAVSTNRQLLRKLAIAEDTDAVLHVLQDTGLNEYNRINRRTISKRFSVSTLTSAKVLAQTFLKPRFGRRR